MILDLHGYELAKSWIVEASWLSRDAVRIYAVLAIQLAASRLFSRRLASPWPLVAVILCEAANEWSGYRTYHALGLDPMAGWLPDTAVDVANSLVLPVLVFLIARFRPGWLTGS